MAYYFNFDVVWANIGNMIVGLGYGILLAVISLFIGIIIGIIAAFAAISKRSTLKKISKWYVTLLRNTPLLVLIYLVYFGFPDLGLTMSKSTSFIFALSLYAGAYMTEVFRAGLQSIPYGILEAGQAIGLSSLQIRFTIQLPIMFRKVLPSMSNYLISLFKDTSLASAITLNELTYFARKLNVETFRVFESWLTAAALYIIACYTIAFLLRKVERKLAIR